MIWLGGCMNWYKCIKKENKLVLVLRVDSSSYTFILPTIRPTVLALLVTTCEQVVVSPKTTMGFHRIKMRAPTITAIRGAETSKDSFHSQNDDHEEYVIKLTGKQQPFACHTSQSPERPCAMPGEAVETTNAWHLGNTIDNDMQEDSASTFHNDNSLASSIECQNIEC